MTCKEYLSNIGIDCPRHSEDEAREMLIRSHQYMREYRVKLREFRKSITVWQRFCFWLADFNIREY